MLASHQAGLWRDTPTLFSHMLRTLGDDPYRADIWFRLGFHHFEEKQGQEAEAALTEAVRLRPGHAASRFYLGVTLLAQRRWAAAAEQLEAALRLDASQTQAHAPLALALDALGRTEEAARHRQAAAALRR
jgi:tetratricopeptide (TPR) repeat protein